MNGSVGKVSAAASTFRRRQVHSQFSFEAANSSTNPSQRASHSFMSCFFSASPSMECYTITILVIRSSEIEEGRNNTNRDTVTREMAESQKTCHLTSHENLIHLSAFSEQREKLY